MDIGDMTFLIIIECVPELQCVYTYSTTYLKLNAFVFIFINAIHYIKMTTRLSFISTGLKLDYGHAVNLI